MVRGNELNDAWMVHWLGRTQSEIINVYCNHKCVVHGNAILVMKSSQQWLTCFLTSGK
jgi:hypothetical protein